MPTQVTEWSDAMMTSLAAAMALLFSAIPKILGFLLIVIAGWFIASLVDKGLAALLRAVRFNELAQKAGIADFVQKMGVDTDAAGMIGLVVKWFIRLIALVVAFDALGLPAVSDVLRQLLLWLPNVIVALVVLVIGGLAARTLSNLVRGAASEAGLTNANMLSKVASVVVWAFTIVVAVNQIGIATELVNTLFMAVVGAMALGLGLAFGLGGRETAAEILRKWYAKAQANAPLIADAADNMGDRMRDPNAMQPKQQPGSNLGGGYSGPVGGMPRPADKRHPSEGA
jgi:small-conductance mechanosensitive channel